MGPGSDDVGRRVLPLLLALYARPGSLRIATCPAQDAREGRLGRERHLHQQGDGSRVRRTSARETDSSSGHRALPPSAESNADEPVESEPVSGQNSLLTGKTTGN